MDGTKRSTNEDCSVNRIGNDLIRETCPTRPLEADCRKYYCTMWSGPALTTCVDVALDRHELHQRKRARKGSSKHLNVTNARCPSALDNSELSHAPM
jgi:hypothetical protein